jgi:hypothetical protein
MILLFHKWIIQAELLYSAQAFRVVIVPLKNDDLLMLVIVQIPNMCTVW